ncbi:MAG: biotin-independent malonate decarboxylase subunit beta [Actinobacteria bacterium]|nr:biotin-independent malonate decarboxylase subunit beta [Actinomycetota bacterium]
MTAPARTKTRFTELSARERAAALLDAGTFRELIGPFERLESPHLEPQGVVPACDDGVVVARGDLGGEGAVVLAVEGLFQGGGIGEVSGAKIAGALELALLDAERGRPVRPVLLLETGGIRLQEANLGLLAVAEIHAAIVALRSHVPVVGVIAGTVGCFGGMAIAAGLCSRVVMTREGRMGLNGPQVIEQEAGVAELDSDDRRLVWETIGGEQRVATGVADVLVEDDVAAIAGAVRTACDAELPAAYRSAQVGHYEARLAGIDVSEPLDGPALRALWGDDGGGR